MKLELLVAVAVVLGSLVLGTLGCEQRMTGFDPAFMRCREWRDGGYTGPILRDAECAGKPLPEIITEE